MSDAHILVIPLYGDPEHIHLHSHNARQELESRSSGIYSSLEIRRPEQSPILVHLLVNELEERNYRAQVVVAALTGVQILFVGAIGLGNLGDDDLTTAIQELGAH